MIDTNVFDKLIADPYFPDIWSALEAKEFQFVTTIIQEEELNTIPDLRQKSLLQSIPRSVVPLWSESSLNVDKHANDQMIAAAALHWAGVLITEDHALHEWIKLNLPSLQVLGYQEFLVWFLSLE